MQILMEQGSLSVNLSEVGETQLFDQSGLFCFLTSLKLQAPAQGLPNPPNLVTFSGFWIIESEFNEIPGFNRWVMPVISKLLQRCRTTCRNCCSSNNLRPCLQIYSQTICDRRTIYQKRKRRRSNVQPVSGLWGNAVINVSVIAICWRGGLLNIRQTARYSEAQPSIQPPQWHWPSILRKTNKQAQTLFHSSSFC